jgi:hypothetical protein
MYKNDQHLEALENKQEMVNEIQNLKKRINNINR